MVNLVSLILLGICIIIAITVHEFSHALAADFLGDPTPRSQGRLSLNPLNHLDPLGTILLFLVHIGWGKPVVIDPYNLKNPKRDELLISLAGPASNLILATILSLIIRFVSFDGLIVMTLSSLIQINVVIAVFNLIPIPPLDGSKVLLSILPEDLSIQWEEAFKRYGYILLLVFLFLPINGSNLANIIMTPALRFIFNLLAF
jgi:Zn-dependent protease